MTFNDIEVSEYFEPIELFTFTRGLSEWFFTSADREISVAGNVYLPIPTSRSRIASTQDIGKTTLRITTSIRNPFVREFIPGSPSGITTVTVNRLHGSGEDITTTFIGRVINVEFSNSESIIVCQSIQSSLRRPGLRRLYQTTCPHVLYGGQCSVVSNAFRITGVLTAIDGLSITSPSFQVAINPTFDPAWFTGGFVEFQIGSSSSRLAISNHDNLSGTLTLSRPLLGVAIGSTINAFAGCNHTPETCAGKFGNIVNYGGFPFIPQKNPMNGTSVF